MTTDLTHFIQKHFRRAENGLMQVILLNALGYLGLLLLKTVLVISGHGGLYTALINLLVLPSSWAGFLQQPWALFTHFWVHLGFFNTLWGLLLLHMVGQVVVKQRNNANFLALYLLGGLAGGGAFLGLYTFAPHFQGSSTSLMGFSGSLYAVMVGAATLAPELTFSLFLLGRIKLKYIVGALLLFAFLQLADADTPASIAHLGGALMGYLYVKQLAAYSWLRKRWARLRKPQQTLKVTHRKRATTVNIKEEQTTTPDQESLDAILDKVSASGYESLTPTEKQALFSAGK
jgi:membrane associated rhomboid family serine protease